MGQFRFLQEWINGMNNLLNGTHHEVCLFVCLFAVVVVFIIVVAFNVQYRVPV